MAFNIYNSGDAGAPTLNGLTGSLLTVLNACLVNGYGSMTGSGWSKPLPDTASYGMFTQGSGSSGLSLFVRDNGVGTGLGREAFMTGWESISSMQSGIVTGSGQFPLSTQLAFVNTGSVVCRKSATADATAKGWMCFADSRTFYFFSNADSTTVYLGFGFGDFYSIKSGSADNYRCFIAGRSSQNSATATIDKLDLLNSTLTTAIAANFVARSYTGLGSSITINKHGDANKGSTTLMNGIVTYPNPADNAIYVTPVWIAETATSVVRGRLRGMWYPVHAISNFADGQILSSSVDQFRTFEVVKQGGNAGVYFMEISDTLETN